MKIVVTYCLLIACLAGFAQTNDTTLLTFDDAVKIALENSVRLNQDKNNLHLNTMQRTGSLAGLGPNVNASFTAARNDGNYFNTNAGRVVNGVNDRISGSMEANLNLFSGFNQINTIRQFTSQLEAQNYLVHRTSQDVMNTVSAQYLEVMLDEELLIIAKENHDVLIKQLSQVKEQVVLGVKSPVDEYNQEAQTKAAELRYVQAEIKLNNDKAVLAQTLLIDPFEQFKVERPNWDINLFDNDPLQLDKLAEQAKQYRGDYLSAVKNADAQRYASYATGGLLLPSLTAFASYGSAYNFQHDVPKKVFDEDLGAMVDNPNFPRPFKEQFTTNNVYKSFGLQLRIPIFNGLQSTTNYVQRRVQSKNAKLTRNNLEFQIKNDVVRAVRNYEGAKKAYSITSDQLKAAEIAFQLETERYSLDIIDFVEYANSNRVYVQAQTDKAQAEYRLVFQKILLEYAVGTLKTENTKIQN